jgi:hypothetical protein
MSISMDVSRGFVAGTHGSEVISFEIPLMNIVLGGDVLVELVHGNNDLSQVAVTCRRTYLALDPWTLD